MMGWMICRDDKYLSPMGYLTSAQHAQWFRTREEAAQAIKDIRRENYALVTGAEPKEVRIPGEGFGSALGTMDAEYNPWGHA